LSFSSEPSPRDHPAANAFVSVAQRYCALLENPVRDRDLWLADVLTTLATIYAAAPMVRELALPTHPAPENIPAAFRLTNDEWTALYTHLKHTLGNDAIYSAQFNPLVPTPHAPSDSLREDETPLGDLADDLADIYRDLKPGLTAWNTQNDALLEDVLFQWVHYGLLHHWGRHAVNAVRALHWLVYK